MERGDVGILDAHVGGSLRCCCWRWDCGSGRVMAAGGGLAGEDERRRLGDLNFAQDAGQGNGGGQSGGAGIGASAVMPGGGGSGMAPTGSGGWGESPGRPSPSGTGGGSRARAVPDRMARAAAAMEGCAGLVGLGRLSRRGPARRFVGVGDGRVVRSIRCGGLRRGGQHRHGEEGQQRRQPRKAQDIHAGRLLRSVLGWLAMDPTRCGRYRAPPCQQACRPASVWPSCRRAGTAAARLHCKAEARRRERKFPCRILVNLQPHVVVTQY